MSLRVTVMKEQRQENVWGRKVTLTWRVKRKELAEVHEAKDKAEEHDAKDEAEVHEAKDDMILSSMFVL